MSRILETLKNPEFWLGLSIVLCAISILCLLVSVGIHSLDSKRTLTDAYNAWTQVTKSKITFDQWDSLRKANLLVKVGDDKENRTVELRKP